MDTQKHRNQRNEKLFYKIINFINRPLPLKTHKTLLWLDKC